MERARLLLCHLFEGINGRLNHKHHKLRLRSAVKEDLVWWNICMTMVWLATFSNGVTSFAEETTGACNIINVYICVDHVLINTKGGHKSWPRFSTRRELLSLTHSYLNVYYHNLHIMSTRCSSYELCFVFSIPTIVLLVKSPGMWLHAVSFSDWQCGDGYSIIWHILLFGWLWVWTCWSLSLTRTNQADASQQ